MTAHNYKYTNRLIKEKSPYLLQHAHNPVDWYPWCNEAFEKASKEDKPIFLSVGYSTCHWCHVMEREDFEHEDVAEILNEHFVSIKVDREEMPEIDDIYMMATSLITQRGGWPNSLWLTTDRKPFYAGTYFPREDSQGMIGFKSILRRIAELWNENRKELLKQAEDLTNAIQQTAAAKPEIPTEAKLNRTLVETGINKIYESYDKDNGGFGTSPKFPPHQILSLLTDQYDKTGNQNILKILTTTLDSMANGGIYDHIGGGFHRYSTDAKWFLPHFEKMLYDNAQLSKVYAEAYLVTENNRYRQIAEETLDWLLRDMVSDDGGFYSAFDADSEGQEGKYYLWKFDEIIEILGPDKGKLFADIYGIKKEGNYYEEATGEKTDQNIAYLPQSIEKIKRSYPENLERELEDCLKKLLDRRHKRIPPHCDDKILANSNGLTIAAMAFSGSKFKQDRYIDAAINASDFILDKMRKDNSILHSYRDGSTSAHGYLDDHCFVAYGFLELHDATGDKKWLDEAIKLVEILFEYFMDNENGTFFNTSNSQTDLLARIKDPADKSIPSGNGMMAIVLNRIARITQEKSYSEHSKKILNFFLPFMEHAPAQTATMIHAIKI
ncbi:MAG: thioredoxin domain-containing protein [Sedimentisphaeraceae bacterium JB056]